MRVWSRSVTSYVIHSFSVPSAACAAESGHHQQVAETHLVPKHFLYDEKVKSDKFITLVSSASFFTPFFVIVLSKPGVEYISELFSRRLTLKTEVQKEDTVLLHLRASFQK